MCDILTVSIGIVKEWQTLAAGVFALVAAILTIRTISRQIRVQETQHLNARKSKAWSARAHLPDVLSSLTKYAKEATRSLLDESAEYPRPPVEAMAELKMIIEHVDTKAAKRIFEITVKYQVQNARLMNFLAKRTPGQPLNAEIPVLLYDLTLLQALVNSLYDFARGEQETGPDAKITHDKALEALKNVTGISYYTKNKGKFDGVKKIIGRRHGVQKS